LRTLTHARCFAGGDLQLQSQRRLAPIFVSANIETLFGYAPQEYLDDPNF
jgi:hypothetical protein